MPRVLNSTLLGTCFSICFTTLALAVTPSKFPAPYVCTRNFYVTTAGADNATCGAPATPCATMAGADAATSIGGNVGSTLTGGDCVNVGAGTYATTGSVSLSHGGSTATRSNGLLNGYVFYVGAPNHGSILSFTADGGGNSGVKFTGSYQGIDGFEIKGDHTGNWGAALEFGGTYESLTGVHHHHWALNNLMHGFAQGGIQSLTLDYAFMYNNEIYDNAQQGTAQGSGITIYDPVSIPSFNYSNGIPDDIQPFHIQVVGNVIHDNQETFTPPPAHSDGNAIIMDDWNTQQWTGGPGQYPFQGLIEGNLTYHNGGRGIEQQVPANLTIINNTGYNDCQDSTLGNCAEIWMGSDNTNGTTSTIENNIAIRNVSTATAYTMLFYQFDAANANHNLTYDPNVGGNKVVFMSTLDDAGNLTRLTANNPKLATNPNMTSLVTPDFHPTTTASVLGAGIAGPATYPLYTPDGFTQPTIPNIGAYNVAGGGAGTGTPISINSGGPAVAPFAADSHFSGSSLTTSNGTGTTDLTGCTGKCAPNAVYQTERYAYPAGSTLTYTFNSADGIVASTSYLVRLHFSEDWPADEVVGGRLINATINSVNKLTKFDIYHTAGNVAHKAVVQDFTVNSTAGSVIAVSLVADATSPDQSAKIDGIEILQPAPPILQTLSLASNTMHTCAAQGTVIGTIAGTTAGSTITIGTQSTANALQVAQVGTVWQLQVGSAALCGAHTYTVSLVETLAGATGTPKTTSGLSVIETCP